MNTYILQNGLIVDGTGAQPYIASVLLRDGRIAAIGQSISCTGAKIIDCTGLAVAPGFIDAHSHNDWAFTAEDEAHFIGPFIRQGITTFVSGNCGHGVAGFEPDTPFREELSHGIFEAALGGRIIPWSSWREYHLAMQRKGMMANLATLAAHGASLGSIVGMGTIGASGITLDIERRVLALLEQGMDEGCVGVSLGLAYRPGNFLRMDQIRTIAALVKKKDKILTVHRGVEGCVSQSYPGYTGAHNVRWLKELFESLRDTGVKLHLSHVLFPGKATWRTFDAVIDMINTYNTRGMDITFDMYPYSLGETEIALQLPAELPPQFARMDADPVFRTQCEADYNAFHDQKGTYTEDMILCNARGDAYLRGFEGMRLDQIAQARGLSDFENIVDIYKRTNGRASIYMTYMYAPGQVETEMCHERVLYMTDAWYEPNCVQNPCVYGSMPRFLRLAREGGNLPLQTAVARMTGKTAERFQLRGRGFIRKGYCADLTIFDPNTVAEQATVESPERDCVGMEYVFVGGELVCRRGMLLPVHSGKILTV